MVWCHCIGLNNICLPKCRALILNLPMCSVEFKFHCSVFFYHISITLNPANRRFGLLLLHTDSSDAVDRFRPRI